MWLRPGDILIQRGNTIEYVGIPAIYDGPERAFIYPDLMMRVRAKKDRVTTNFLWIALSWGLARTYLRERATGTAGSMPEINQQTLIDVPIDLPGLPEQKVIVERANALFALADRLEARYAKTKRQVDKLSQPESPRKLALVSGISTALHIGIGGQTLPTSLPSAKRPSSIRRGYKCTCILDPGVGHPTLS